MIEIKNLSKFYANSGVTTLGLHNINLTFKKGEIVGIVGESGSGKSTLLNVISGMDSYDEGEIFYEGEETSYFDENDRDEFRKKNVAFINQNYNIIDSYSVLENVTLPLLINGMDEKEAIKRAKVLIDRVHLTHRIKSKGSKLSGGEKQRCVIARALAKDTPILACDEPTGNLDSKTGEEIIELIKEVSEGKLVLIVTHNEEQANPILTRKIRIHDGQVAEDINMSKSQAVNDKVVESAEIKKNRWFRPSMAWKNIKGTPKKNFFSTLVYTVFSFVLMFLYLLSSQSSTDVAYSNSSHFKNVVRERMIVFREDRKPVDVSKFSSISGDKFVNAFYEDVEVLATRPEDQWGSEAVMSRHMPANARLYSTEETRNEALENVAVVVSDEHYYLAELGMDLVVRQRMGFGGVFMTIVDSVHVSSIYICEEISTPMMVFDKGFDADKFNRVFQNYYLLTDVVPSTGEPYSSDKHTIRLTPAGKSDQSAGLSKNKLIHTGRTKIADETNIAVKGLIGGMYETTFKDFDYEFVSADVDDLFDFRCANPELPSECYELTIYPDNMKVAERTAKLAGYNYIIPSKAISENAMLKNIKRVIAIMFYIQISMLGFALSFAVYGILTRIYKTKVKDFTIFRSLGVLKSDLRGAVRLEIAFIAFVASAISVIAVLVLSFTTEYFHKLIMSANPFAFVFFFVIMQLLGLLISTRFSNRLFNLSITDSLKEERR